MSLCGAFAHAKVVDGESRIPESPIVGSLRVVGHYPVSLAAGDPVIVLPNGLVFLHGRDTTDQLIWDPSKRGWIRGDKLPDCSDGKTVGHTMTALADNTVLIVGGICERLKMVGEKAPPEYRKLSLLNAATGKWELSLDLKQGRQAHTANLLPDASVLIVGGESVSEQIELKNKPVLLSVERYAAGKVEEMPPLNVARAQHTATVFANGAVLVAGGYDNAGAPLTSAEVWDPVIRSWKMARPMKIARHSHSAVLLDDGRIMLVGGIDAKGARINSVEIWNPTWDGWIEASKLSSGLSKPAVVLLEDGNLFLAGGATNENHKPLSWTWVWEKISGRWLPAGDAESSIPTYQKNMPTLLKNSDGSIHIFGSSNIMQWQRLTTASTSQPPKWLYNTPTMTVLSDGRVMTMGHVQDADSKTHRLAHLWNPATNVWTKAGDLAIWHGLASGAIQFRSGRVLHVGLDGQNRLACQIWQPTTNAWNRCDVQRLEKIGDGVALNLLDDGRVVAITSTEEAHLFDERTGEWSKAKLEVSMDGVVYGAPVHVNRPFATLTDEKNLTYDVTPLVGRLWNSIASAPEILWDTANKRWAYIFSGGTFGRKSEMLSDGCAIALASDRGTFALFDGATGKVKKLSSPTTGILHPSASMTVLKDGTVVVVGPAESGGNNFFYRKVSCAGFETSPDDLALMPGVFYQPPPVVQKLEKPVTQDEPTLLDRLKSDPVIHVVLLVVIGLFVLIRFVVMPWLRRGARKVMSEESASKLDRRIPGWISWTIRLSLLAIVIMWFFPMMRYVFHKEVNRDEIKCSENAADCVDKKTGILRSEPKAAADGAKPAIPCLYVGEWTMTGADKKRFRLTFKDDGTYIMHGNPGSSGGRTLTGYWVVQGDRMVWRHTQGVTGEADINQIVPESSERFYLIEQNGWRTRFDLIKAEQSTKCMQ